MGKGLKTAGIIAGVAATFAAGVMAEKKWQVSAKVANLANNKKKEEHDDAVVAQVAQPTQPTQQASKA